MPTSLVGGPQPLHARQGREMQRYSQDGARLVAGCIPVRVSEVNGKVDVSVLMITSRGGKGLVFPKGGWEADETVEAAAARETVEEAGVRGALEDDMVGAFPFKSTEELPTWPEGAERKRIWCSAEKAVELCRHDWMRDALKTRPTRPVDKEHMMLSAIKAPCFAGQCLTNKKLHQRSATQKLRLAPCAAIQLDDLPYSLDALEPHMSKSTFEVHWGKHHRTYVNNLNNQIQGKDLESKSLEEIVKATWNGGSPSAEFNNAAQSWNHKFFWHSMKPGGGGEPSGELKSAIEKDFGSFEDFKKEFSTAGATQFGSGWAWLVKDGGKLKVIKTPNAETPLASGAGVPLLTMDVWEHAYYLDVQNRRPDYIKTFLGELVNWDAVAERFASA
ncbi:hypothetical protein WJX77_010059 [Trebouxia sp. C0004]